MQKSNHFKPSKHLDVKDILNQNYLLVDNATQLVNKVNKKIIELNQKFYKSTEQQQIIMQVDLDQLQLKLEDYSDHLQYCIDSLQNAIDKMATIEGLDEKPFDILKPQHPDQTRFARLGEYANQSPYRHNIKATPADYKKAKGE